MSENYERERIAAVEAAKQAEPAPIERQELGKGIELVGNLESVVKGYQAGKLEWEAFSPYIKNYLMSSEADLKSIFDEYDIKSDQIGIAIAKTLKDLFPESRMISLYDEYNVVFARDVKGQPMGPAEVPEEMRQNFKSGVEELLRDRGVIKEDDKENGNYLLISETEKVKDAEELVRRIEEGIGQGKINGKLIHGLVEGEASNTLGAEKLKILGDEVKDQITFITDRGKKIRLRDKFNHWICEALDASSYLKPENLEKTHLVVLPESFKEQQANVRELLKCMGIEMTNYHNIFFNEDLKPAEVAEVIREEIEKAKQEK